MKTVLFALALFGSASALACPGDRFEIHQVSLDANGAITRTETRERPATNPDGSPKMVLENVVVDKLTLEAGDEIKLNAAPGTMDLTVYVVVKRADQQEDAGGILSTTYSVREITTSGWTGQTSERRSLVKVRSSYLGNGTFSKDGCGSVEVKRLPNSTVPTIRKF